MRKLILIALTALATSVCAFAGEGIYYIRNGQHTTDFSEELFQQITGRFANKVQSDLAWHTNSIEITPEGVITARVAAQVGRENNTQFPYPTVCVLDYHGKVKQFYLEDAKAHPDEKAAPYYYIDMEGPELTLVDDPKNSSLCEEFVRMNNEKPLTWFWMEFSLKEGALVERGEKSIFERVASSGVNSDAGVESTLVKDHDAPIQER
jgi:hypothetical protein